jgi:hypothetical protein
VVFGVLFRGVLVVLYGVQVMSVSYLGMMRGLFVVAGFVVLGGLTVVLGRMLVMMGGFLVMLVDIVTVHGSLPGYALG